MIILQQNQVNEINIELLKKISNSYWLFVFTMQDLVGQEERLFIAAASFSSRYYTFNFNTTTTPLKTGEWVLKIYEKSSDANTSISGLEPSYISKVRIYKTFAESTYKSITIVDERID